MKRILLFSSALIILGSLCPAISHGQSAIPIPQAMKTKMLDLETQKQFAERRLAELNEKLDTLQAKRAELVDQQDVVGVSSEAFEEVTRTLQAQSIQLSIDLAGLEAKRELLAQASRELETKNQSEVIQPLSRLLELETQNLDSASTKHKRGELGASELRKAQIQKLNAEIRLAEAKRSSGSDELTQELFASSLARAEKSARADRVNELLETLVKNRKSYQSGANLAKEINVFENEIYTQERQFDSIEAEIESLQREIRNLR